MSSDSGQTAAVRTIGRYRTFDELGRGAMGVVYRGFDPVIGRTVALKTLMIDTGDAQAREFRDRLYREAAAAGALSHPNIVTIFDIIEDGGVTAVAMEFIEGRSLAAIISERAPLALDAALEIFSQICSALDYAGSHGIVHRDIKPANILMTPDGRAKIADFGVARLALSTMTQAGTVLGSPSYMSPEQVRGLPLDGRSDLFSAAVVFFEMVTRERPFAGDDVATTMYRIAHEPPTPPSRFNAAIGPDVTAVLERSFAKDPANRYQTGADLVAELRRASTPGAAEYGFPPPSLAGVGVAPPPPVPPIVTPLPAVGTPMVPTAAMPGPLPPTVGVIQETVLVQAHPPEVPVFAPIPTSGASLSPTGSSDFFVPLPSIPSAVPPGLPPVMPSWPSVTPAPASGSTRRLAMIGAAAGAVLLIAVAVGVFVMRGGGAGTPAESGVTAPEPAVETSPPPALLPPPAAPQITPPTSTIPPPTAPAGPPGAGLRAGTPQMARPKTPVHSASPDPRAGVNSAAQTPTTRAAEGSRSAPGHVFDSTQVDERPQVVSQTSPVYPESAARRRLEDVVVLRVLVGTNGRASDVQVLRTSAKDPGFDAAAITAVRQWVFSPARKSGQPVPCWFSVGVPFQLRR